MSSCASSNNELLSSCRANVTTNPAKMPTEILVFGAGAIGAFYGSRLAVNKDVNVSVVCRSNYQAVKAQGFQIQSPQFGNYTWSPTRTFLASDVKKAKVNWDYVVVSTKALPDVSDDSELVEGLVGDGTAIMLIQNGLGVEEPYSKRFPQAVVLSAVTVTSAAQPENGVIKHNKWTRINSGPYPDNSPRAMEMNRRWNELLVASGIKDASGYDAAKMQLLRWHKIAINAAFNPSSVLAGCADNASMSHDPDTYEHLKAVMHEVFDAAYKVIGQEFPKDFATAEQILKSTQRNTSGSKPSMALDWESGKRMELEVILGNPVRLAREKGVNMPRLHAMYSLLKMAQKRRDLAAKSKI